MSFTQSQSHIQKELNHIAIDRPPINMLEPRKIVSKYR